jgi:hypothetical protein
MAAMPGEPCDEFRFGAAARLDWRLFAAVGGYLDLAGVAEKDFVSSKPYF